MDKADLDLLTEVAGTFLSIEHIAMLLGVPEQSLQAEIDSESGEVYMAYTTGRLQTEFDVRKSVFTLAKAGSSPAQALAIQYIQADKRKR